MNGAPSHAGFTLVEVAMAVAVAAVLAGMALPSLADRWRQARRSDGIVALTRLQMAQEQYRAHHGLYAPQLQALRLGTGTDAGYYDVQLQPLQPHAYVARAVAREGGPQAADGECQTLRLEVHDGMASLGPQTRCWNR